MAAPPASFAAVRHLNTKTHAAMAIGLFTALPGLDKPITVRAAVIRAPGGGTFSAYLADTLREQLRLAGKLDAQSPVSISGELVESRIDEGVAAGNAILAARFTVRRGAMKLYDKTQRAEAHWTSSLIGAIAIPAAERGYSGLFGAIVEQLAADPDFQRATAR